MTAKNGVYAVGAQNGFNGYQGPQAPAYPGFATTNTAAQTLAAGYPNSFVEIPALNINGNNMTVTAWINPNDWWNTNSQAIFSCHTNTSQFVFGFNTNGVNPGIPGTLGYNWAGLASSYGWNSGLTVPTNEWSMVSLVITPTNATIYAMTTNGFTSASTTNAHVTIPFANDSMIGFENYNSELRTFDGGIDDVGIFNYPLTSAQLNSMFVAATGVGQPNFTVQPLSHSVAQGFSTQFTTTVTGATSYQWKAGAVGSGVYTNLTDTGEFSGTTTATLTINPVGIPDGADYVLVANNAFGSTVSTKATLTVVPTPVPSFVVFNPTGPAPLAVNFSDGTTIGTFTSAHWDFGDGNVTNDTSLVVHHTYTGPPGQYTVMLTVTNSVGGYATSTQVNVVTVTGTPPVPAFALSTTSTATNVVVIYTNETSGTVTSVLWNFGDGQTSTSVAPTVTHFYTLAGTYNVTLAATNSGAGAITGSQSILVTNIVGVSSVAGNPGIKSVKVAGGYVTIIGTNIIGSSGHVYNVLTHTNVAALLNSWTATTNGTFAADGGFTNIVPVGDTRQFYIIQAPTP
jgi:PKD repeat protein